MANEYYGANSLSSLLYDVVEDALRPPAPEIAFYKSIAEGLDTPILDVGCGTGRIAIPLAEAGHKVLGLDVSEEMIRMSDLKKRTCHPDVQGRLDFQHGNILSFQGLGEFSLIIAPFRVFNFLYTEQDRRLFLDFLYKHLSSDGCAVIDTWGGLRAPSPVNPNGYIQKIVINLQGTKYKIGWAVRDQVIDQSNKSCQVTVDYTIMHQDGSELRKQSETLRMDWLSDEEMIGLIEGKKLKIISKYSHIDKNISKDAADRIWLLSRNG